MTNNKVKDKYMDNDIFINLFASIKKHFTKGTVKLDSVIYPQEESCDDKALLYVVVLSDGSEHRLLADNTTISLNDNELVFWRNNVQVGYFKLYAIEGFYHPYPGTGIAFIR